jgi:hypothetical protein
MSLAPVPPSALEGDLNEGVSLNSYVEQLDQYLEKPPPEPISDIPDNPYQ